jgi:hypothetical protein
MIFLAFLQNAFEGSNAFLMNKSPGADNPSMPVGYAIVG